MKKEGGVQTATGLPQRAAAVAHHQRGLDLAASRARLFPSQGLTLSGFDVLIFAAAEHHNANIITIDQHFAQMREALKNGI